MGAGEFSEKKEKLSVTLKLLIMVFFPLTLSPFFLVLFFFSAGSVGLSVGDY